MKPRITRIVRIKILLILCLTSYILPLTPVFGGQGTSGGRVLLKGIGARPWGLGEAFVAVADDVNTLGYNPAGLEIVPGIEIGAMWLKDFADTSYGGVDYLQPLGRLGTMGLSVHTLQAALLQVNYLDGSSKKIRPEQDYIVTSGYAKRIIGDLSLGVNFKVLHSILAEQSKATAFACDFGLLARFLERFSVGISVQNLGNELTYKGGLASGNYSDSLPLMLRMGVAYRILSGRLNNLLLTGQIDKLQEEKLRKNVGIEYRLGNLFALRGGYGWGYSLSSFTVGLGFNLKWFQIDYGYALMGEMGATHRAGMITRFGSAKKSPAKATKSRRPEKTAKISQKGVNYIWGEVIDDLLMPVSRAVVKVSKEDFVKRWRTNEKGIFKTEELPFGTYELKVWKKGYHSLVKKVEVKKGVPTEVNFVLSREK